MTRLGLAAALLLAACGGAESTRVIVGAGTTLVDSGFIDALVATYEADHDEVELSVIGESSARVLALGQSGTAEVLITHAPDQEAAFDRDAHPRLAEVVFTSEFVLVGPEGAVADMAGFTIDDAFRVIAERQIRFISRGDNSGTHEVEQAIWRRVGVRPGGDWYSITGQGMGPTLQVADQREAFTLAEAGAFAGIDGSIQLAMADVRNVPTNPYRLTLIEGASDQAEAFAEWLLSDEGRDAIERTNLTLFGTVIYEP